MIRQLAQAIRQHYLGATELQDVLTGGLWFQRGPQNETFPYAILYIIGADKEQFLGASNQMKRVQVQISIFSDATDGGDTIMLATEKFADAFDWCELHINGYYSVKMENTLMGPISNIDDIWQSILNYEVWFVKE